MPKYIAILRGINVGGKRKIPMAGLRALFAELGFTKVKTYIQSGNVIFESEDNHAYLANETTKAIKLKFGFEVPVIIRTEEEWRSIAANNPYLKKKDIAFEHLYVTFLSQTPFPSDIESIKVLDFAPDGFKVIGKNIYGYSEGPFHKSKLSNNFFEKKLNTSASTRNWKTVLKILEMLN